MIFALLYESIMIPINNATLEKNEITASKSNLSIPLNIEKMKFNNVLKTILKLKINRIILVISFEGIKKLAIKNKPQDKMVVNIFIGKYFEISCVRLLLSLATSEVMKISKPKSAR